MALSGNSLGFGIGLSGKPGQFNTAAYEKIKQYTPKPAKELEQDFTPYIKMDGFHPVVQQEALDTANEFFNYISQRKKNPNDKYAANLINDPEVQRKVTETQIRLDKLRGETKRIGAGIQEYMTNKDRGQYEINQAADNILGNSEASDIKTLNKQYRSVFGGDYLADKHFKKVEQNIDLVKDAKQNVMPVIMSALEKKSYSVKQPDGTYVDVKKESLSESDIKNILGGALANQGRLKQVQKDYSSISQEEQLKYPNGAVDWYYDKFYRPAVRDFTLSKERGKGEQSLRAIGNGIYTNNDFNYAFLKGSQGPETIKLSETISGLTNGNYATDEIEGKFSSVMGHPGTKMVFTRSDKATENKQLTFRTEEGEFAQGVPLGIVEKNNKPFVVVSIPSQKMLTKTIKDAYGNTSVVNVPAAYDEKLVPFTGENQGKILVEYRGAYDAINKENPEWIKENIKVETPTPKASTTKIIDEKITVEKDGKKYKLPKSQLNQAVKQGFKLVQ